VEKRGWLSPKDQKDGSANIILMMGALFWVGCFWGENTLKGEKGNAKGGGKLPTKKLKNVKKSES